MNIKYGIAALSLAFCLLVGPAAADADFDHMLQVAEQGDPEAQATIGGAYFYGIGTPRDFAKAARWFQRAVEQGDFPSKTKAMAMLSVLYKYGIGVPQDKVLAHMWVNLAVAAGHGEATSLRNELANDMTPDQLAEAERMAREWVAAHPPK